jgi:hypothetical protein
LNTTLGFRDETDTIIHGLVYILFVTSFYSTLLLISRYSIRENSINKFSGWGTTKDEFGKDKYAIGGILSVPIDQYSTNVRSGIFADSNTVFIVLEQIVLGKEFHLVVKV